jgi:phage shock protein A
MKKQLLYWLMGDRAARLMIGTWNWLWGVPVESGGKIAVEVAQESLQSMQQSVAKLAESVAKVVASHNQAQALYEKKQKEFKEFEHRALLAQRTNHPEAARMAMMQAITVEKLLPQLGDRVAHAEQVMNNLKAKLDRERRNLEEYKAKMQNIQALAEVNAALADISRVNAELDLGSAKSQFETANTAVQSRYQYEHARAELAENPAEKLTAELDQLTLDDEILHRLKQLEDSSVN